ncbi:MAG: 3-deoxy-D-manno-octulosonic acid transferase [Victivallales bacterium]|nr:3-deoxy-D-manno-octulosonic acid transferase [Victivallales bacterium]
MDHRTALIPYMYFLYNLIFPLIFLCYLPFYLVHIVRRGGLTREYWQRFGFFGADIKKTLRGLHSPVWLHAVSVGESIAAITFLKEWQKHYPEDNIVFSCSTSTAYHTIKNKNLPGVTLIYCPFDFYWAIAHVLNLVRPRAVVIFEVEIWPNLVRLPASRGIPVHLVNGRMSDKSSHGYAKWPSIFQPIFRAFTTINVQTQEDAARIERVIGPSPKIHVCDTMKFDQVPDVSTVDVGAALDGCFGTGERLVLVAGSTHPGEEERILDAYLVLRQEFPSFKLVLVPRHCERTPEVVELLHRKNLSVQLLKNDPTRQQADVLLVNTTGELMNFYAAADIAFVGKSIGGQEGGHNIIEPAIYGKAIVHGPHMENFRAVAEIFQQRKAAIQLQDDAALLPVLRNLLEHPEQRNALGTNARATVDRYRGAIQRTLQAIDQA